MLNKIYPEDVAESWEVFAPLIAKSIPPILGGNVNTMTSILEAIMVETLDCWVLLGRNSDNQNMKAFATTHIVEDELTREKSLLIYTLTAMPKAKIVMEDWSDAFETLRKYAHAKGCSYISAFSDLPNVIALAKKVGANVKTTFIRLEV